MKRKIVIIIISFLSITTSYVYAQELSALDRYLIDSDSNSLKKDFVLMRITLNQKPKKKLFYSIQNYKYILAKNIDESNFQEKEIKSPNLFQIIYDNYFDIFHLKDFLIESPKYIHQCHDKFFNDTNDYAQLGIRYGKLYYNHFPKFSEEDLLNKKNKKVKKGMEAINKLYEIFEKLEPN